MEDDHVISMENWDGVSLHVAPPSPVVLPLDSSAPGKGEVLALSNNVMSSTSPGKNPHLFSKINALNFIRKIALNISWERKRPGDGRRHPPQEASCSYTASSK